MFILIEKVYDNEDSAIFVMGAYDTMEMAQQSQTALESRVDIDDGIVYDIQCVPKNLDVVGDDE